ncbi:MAG: TraR/DksA C4-type zinc finger protein [Rhizobiaceae bacterium]
MAVDLDKVRGALGRKRQEIEAESALAADARETVELDQQSVGRLSRMDAMQAQAMAQAQERRRQNELARIELALRRIDAGDYGYCTQCDDEIAPGRLEIDPMAERCIKCA